MRVIQIISLVLFSNFIAAQSYSFKEMKYKCIVYLLDENYGANILDTISCESCTLVGDYFFTLNLLTRASDSAPSFNIVKYRVTNEGLERITYYEYWPKEWGMLFPLEYNFSLKGMFFEMRFKNSKQYIEHHISLLTELTDLGAKMEFFHSRIKKK